MDKEMKAFLQLEFEMLLDSLDIGTMEAMDNLLNNALVGMQEKEAEISPFDYGILDNIWADQAVVEHAMTEIDQEIRKRNKMS